MNSIIYTMYLKLFRSENISQIHVSKLLHKEVLDSRIEYTTRRRHILGRWNGPIVLLETSRKSLQHKQWALGIETTETTFSVAQS